MTYQKVSASGIVLNQKGEILMLKRSEQDDFLPGIFALPGGGTDFQETPETGLCRELKEECGIEVSVEHPLTTFSFMMPHEGVEKHTVEIVFLCRLLQEQEVKLSFEHSGYRWVKFEEVTQIETTEFLMGLLQNLREHPLVKTYVS